METKNPDGKYNSQYHSVSFMIAWVHFTQNTLLCLQRLQATKVSDPCRFQLRFTHITLSWLLDADCFQQQYVTWQDFKQ